jgi:hypothetical protein
LSFAGKIEQPPVVIAFVVAIAIGITVYDYTYEYRGESRSDCRALSSTRVRNELHPAPRFDRLT